MDNKNSIIAILVLAALLFSLFTVFSSSEWSLKTSARSAMLYCPENDEILYAKNESMRLPMASTTKIMTALVAIENCNLSDEITISPEAVGIEGSSAYLRAHDTYTLEELLYALLLQSANDAAVAISLAVCDSTDEFVALMNERAVRLGAYNTSFSNPSGLDDEDHYTTASDLSKIAAAALSNDIFSKIVKSEAKTITSDEGTVRSFKNHNKLLYKYEDCIGVKTGYTKKSGRCLVGAAERDGLTLITVTLDDSDDWNDHIKMLDYGFSIRQKILLAKKNEIKASLPVISGTNDNVTATNIEEIYAVVPKTKETIKHEIIIPKYLIAPLSNGERVGEVVFSLSSTEIASAPLYIEMGVKYKNKK